MSIEGDLMTAAEALGHALLDLADRHELTPCQGRRRDRWTSDDATDREWAAAVCVGLDCVVLTECGNAAAEQGERFGVWAGVDRTPPPARPKPTRQTRPGCEAAA